MTVNLPINRNKRERKESKILQEEKIQQPSGEINSALRKVTALYSHFSSGPLASFPNGKQSSTDLWHQPHKVNVVKESLTGRRQIRRQEPINYTDIELCANTHYAVCSNMKNLKLTTTNGLLNSKILPIQSGLSIALQNLCNCFHLILYICRISLPFNSL